MRWVWVQDSDSQCRSEVRALSTQQNSLSWTITLAYGLDYEYTKMLLCDLPPLTPVNSTL